jgi:imidazolonepropionase-like amidohydrolase
VQQGLITRVTPWTSGEPIPAGTHDYRGRTFAPGMIDAHCHLGRVGLFEPHEAPNADAVVTNLRSALASGVTTAGDMGCTAPLIATLRAHTAREPSAGPAIRASGPLLTVPLGYPLDWMSPLHRSLRAALPCGDRASARRAVREIAEAGMDHVKVCIMHRGYDLSPLPTFSRAVATALVEEAHALGLRVLAHAHWNADYRVALAAGVDALMHSSFDPLDDETVARVRDSGVGVCPTLWVFHSACLGAEERWDRDPSRTRDLPPVVERSWRRFAEAYAASGDVLPKGIAGGLAKSAARDGVRNAVANLLLLREAGVPFAYGTDGPYGFSVVGRPSDELSTLHAAGLDAAECLRAATSGAARVLGLSDRGVIEAGQRADLVVFEGDPRRDLGALGRAVAVYRAGRAVDPTRPARGPSRQAVRAGIGRTLASAFVTKLSQSD